MSEAPVPYVAPWQTAWTRYATQTFTPQLALASRLALTIPTDQWWRPVYIQAGAYGTTAGLQRILRFDVVDRRGASTLQVYGPGTFDWTTTTIYVWGPGLAEYSVAGGDINDFHVAPIPDLLWPPGYALQVNYINQTGNDAFVTTPSRIFAVEVYSEERPGVFVPAVPTPILA